MLTCGNVLDVKGEEGNSLLRKLTVLATMGVSTTVGVVPAGVNGAEIPVGRSNRRLINSADPSLILATSQKPTVTEHNLLRKVRSPAMQTRAQFFVAAVAMTGLMALPWTVQSETKKESQTRQIEASSAEFVGEIWLG